MVTDWKEVELLSLSDGGMQNGVFYEVSRKGSGIPLINVGDMYTKVPITSEKLELFDATDDEIKRFEVNDGDLFFTRSSVVPSGIAFCNWYKKTSNKPVVFDSHVIRFKTDKNQVVPMFLYLQCISPKARRFFIANAKTATMTTIDQTIMGKCIIDLPPLPEQRRIAEVLSDTDALITAVERLIAKKRAIKQGAMQELLTGKRRLPGFKGEWVEKKLEQTYINITTGKLDANAMTESGMYRFYTCAKEYFFIDNYAFDDEALLISGNGANVGYIHYYKGKFNAYQRTYVLTGFKESIFYIKHYLCKFLSERIEKEVNAGGTPFIKKNTIDEMIIVLPPTIAEQTAIAEILSDMDAEIDKLTAKLTKLRGIKQGIMSELLTGRIRLVEQDATTNTENLNAVAGREN